VPSTYKLENEGKELKKETEKRCRIRVRNEDFDLQEAWPTLQLKPPSIGKDRSNGY
jgi:hypothetical protein